MPTNAPQTTRVWPGLRLIGAGGKVQKGTFLTVEAVEGDVVRLESGQSFAGPELLKHTRLCSAITYASVQGLTLRGRVWLLHGLLPGHQFGAFERSLRLFRFPEAKVRTRPVFGPFERFFEVVPSFARFDEL